METKLFKYELKNTDQFIEVPLVYVEQHLGEIKFEFLVTSDLLDEFSISAKTFISYLKGELKSTDPDFRDAAELYASNQPLHKTKLLQESKSGRNNITEIITANGTEYFKPTQSKFNFFNRNNQEK